MITKIKNLVKISQRIEGISKQVDDNSNKVMDHSKTLHEYHDIVKQYNEKIQELHLNLTNMKEDAAPLIDNMIDIHKAMKNELFEIKMVKSELKSKIITEITDTFREELYKQTKALDTDVKRFNELKQEMETLTQQFQGLKEEVTKLKSVAKEVKSADFTLAKHAQELTKNDLEKLRLMKENDNLKRLISKERRKRL